MKLPRLIINQLSNPVNKLFEFFGFHHPRIYPYSLIPFYICAIKLPLALITVHTILSKMAINFLIDKSISLFFWFPLH